VKADGTWVRGLQKLALNQHITFAQVDLTVIQNWEIKSLGIDWRDADQYALILWLCLRPTHWLETRC